MDWSAHAIVSGLLGGTTMARVRLLWGLLCVFSVAVSANMFASAAWDWLVGAPALSVSARVATLLVSLAVFLGGAGWLFYERHRVLDAVVIPGIAEPRPVLVTGLSNLGVQPLPPSMRTQLNVAEDLVRRVRAERVPLGDLAAPADKFPKGFGEEVKRLPWIQNLRAISYHQLRLERIVVVPSNHSKDQFDTFQGLVQALIANTAEFNGREIEIIAAGGAPVYDDFGAVQSAFNTALRVARAPRPVSSGAPAQRGLFRLWRWRREQAKGYAAHHLSIDITPGTKLVTVVAAAASFGVDGRFLYVDGNPGAPKAYNIALRLGSALAGG